MSDPIFEVCLQSVDDVVAAQAGGAQRVELCAALVEGGVTPSLATIAACAALPIEVMVMIRPRGGDFDYTARELAVMEADIAHCRELGVAGVVFGMLTPQGQVARPQVQRLLAAAGPLQVCFHRAFDVCRDPLEALDILRDLGVRRVLTSGQAATVPEGLDLIQQLVDRAGSDIEILPGCGITVNNVAHVLRYTGARQFHATAFREVDSRMQHRNDRIYMGVPGWPEYRRAVTDQEVVEKYLRAAVTCK
ncbi:Copper homeostasis protein CutC [Neolewinella maritima]|uniref:PF03932 family protein CutC n=1 Tax=Neolewinella maritima TaxID=1383882 RepID=A0ABN8F3V1_9BACT|nr:copper homeostasis protein CutC [Neolewinella maritima]CAH1000470.1 Copper homeostasis protein CutC [Neolewinella maritima]